MATAYTTVEKVEFLFKPELTICNLFYSSTESGTPWGGGWKTKSFPKSKSAIDILKDDVSDYLKWCSGKEE